MTASPTTHTWMTAMAVASRRPRACPCGQQGLRPASNDLLGHGRPQAHVARKAVI